jgi:hypothetical protein
MQEVSPPNARCPMVMALLSPLSWQSRKSHLKMTILSDGDDDPVVPASILGLAKQQEVTVLSDGDDDPVVPAGDAGRVPLPAHQNKGYKTS